MAGWPSTIDGIAEKVLRQLEAYYAVEHATLASNEAASSGSLTLNTGHASALNLGIGDVIEVNAELMLITAVSTDTLTVSNAWQGTTAAAHDTGDMVRLHPRVGRQDVYEAMESVVMSWDDLYTVKRYTASVDFQDGGARSAEITGAPADFKTVKKMFYKNEDDVWVAPKKQWTVREVPDVSSGLVLQWEAPFWEKQGTATVSVYLAERFNTEVWDADTDLVSDIGLERSMLDVLYYGTMFFILLPEETQRADFDSQPQPRDAQEVPPGYLAQTGLSFKVLHDQRVSVEAKKLNDRWKQD